MSFNWFNRPAEEVVPTPTEETPPIAAAATPTAEEALAFAKAAYDRLKQKQQDTSPVVTVVEEVAENVIGDEALLTIEPSTEEIAVVEESAPPIEPAAIEPTESVDDASSDRPLRSEERRVGKEC